MTQAHFRHIFLPGPSRTQNYTNPHHGGNPPSVPPRNRAEHSVYLQQRLAEAWRDADTAHAVAYSEGRGTYIEFVSEPGFDLALKSLENLKSGVRLLNVKRQGDAGHEKTLATVYVPRNKRHLFLNKLRQYAKENTSKTDKPKNANLVESISDIHLAMLKSFWQDEPSLLPGEDSVPIEVWLSNDSDEKIEKFNQLLLQLNIKHDEGTLKFPERSVEVIHTNRSHLEKLIQESDDIAEFRTVPSVASFFIELSNKDQLTLVQDILKRTKFELVSNVVICILDTGINNGHLLLRPVLDDADLLTAQVNWGTNDHAGHGTLMAGTATYGDLLNVLNSSEPFRVFHRLESVKILPPPPAHNPKELWGYLTAQGLYRAEIQAPQRKRIACLAVTSPENRERGRPSSWSAMIDSLTSGYKDDPQRLIIISAGNIEDSNDWLLYPDSNKTNEIHDPGQSWNALTVGAFTEKAQIHDATLAGYTSIAPAGGLSPFSTTSNTWQARKWPIKPEIVLEGGNAARGPNNSVINPDELALLSTFRDPQIAQFATFSMTSASAAQAAWMAARIQTQYPNAWPETIRALLVHSAQWTDTMISQFRPTPTKPDYARLLRICGYGTPILNDALHCASNSLTLVSQAELQPYEHMGNRYVTRDMHLYNLPWPSDILSELGGIQVTMRVTLSYFIEPGPGEIGWDNRYRYPSHGLRFDINGPTESEENFIRRINLQARDDGEHPGTQGPSDKWIIGDARNVGSIHSDIWQGRAADLATSNKIAVYPTIGWWRERSYLNRWNKKCRYSLVVSIHTPSPEIDIYTPVAIQVGVVVPITITTTS